MTNQLNDSWHSYPKVYALGHAAIAGIFDSAVIVEEKIDGSQFSFGRFGGELRCRSKGVQLDVNAPEKMFAKAVEVVSQLPLRDGWTYRAEYLQSPKHNTLAYDRIPRNHLMIFDVNYGHEKYLDYWEKKGEATRIGLECVPNYQLSEKSPEAILALLQNVSALGGQKIEGVVVKNYSRFSLDGKAMIGKYVSEAFKEVHGKEWKKSNPTQSDIIEQLIERHRTPARWSKAVQHLREAGKLEGSPKDIGALLKEVGRDTYEECAPEIQEALMKWAWGRISRGIINGFPEWYKEQLLKQQFENKEAA